MPQPSGGKQATILVSNVQYAVLKASKHQQLAEEFVKFVASDPGVQDRAFAATGDFPTYKPSFQKLYASTTDAATKQFMDSFQTSQVTCTNVVSTASIMTGIHATITRNCSCTIMR